MAKHKGSSQRANEFPAGEPVASNAQAAGTFPRSSMGSGQLGSIPTEHSIRACSNEEVALYLYDYAGYLIDREWPPPWEEIVPSLPVGLRTVYMVVLTVNEVYNGGFEQLFWNHGVQMAPYAAEALQLIGFSEARLVLAAKQLHEAEMAKTPVYASQEYPGSYGFEDMQSLDLQFCAAADDADVFQQLVEYIRANPASCVSSEG